MVHDAEMSDSDLHSFADEVWQGASEATIRCVPPKFEHSIAWLIWHIACIEDMTTELSQRVDIDALKTYRLAVGHSTREAVKALQPDDFKVKVAPACLQELFENGSVVKEATDLLDYWGNLTKAGLLLMPPTRHNFVQLNEAMKIKKRCSS